MSMLEHHRPYVLQWLNECKEVRVDKQVLVSLTIGKYIDEDQCNMVPMHDGYVILGKSCQYDRKVIYDGYKNRFDFMKDEKSITLILLIPKQVYENQLKLRDNKERETSEVDENNEKRVESSEKRKSL